MGIWDALTNLLGLFVGGGFGTFVTWRWMKRKAKAEAEIEEVNMAKAVQDTYQQMLADKDNDIEDRKKVIAELREERDSYRADRNELRDRLEKMETGMLEMQREIAKNARMVESLRPFVCANLSCTLRQRDVILEGGADRPGGDAPGTGGGTGTFGHGGRKRKEAKDEKQ